MKVYIAIAKYSEGYDEPQILGVFSTLRKADDVCQKQLKAYSLICPLAYAEEYELDEEPEIDDEMEDDE